MVLLLGGLPAVAVAQQQKPQKDASRGENPAAGNVWVSLKGAVPTGPDLDLEFLATEGAETVISSFEPHRTVSVWVANSDSHYDVLYAITDRKEIKQGTMEMTTSGQVQVISGNPVELLKVAEKSLELTVTRKDPRKAAGRIVKPE